MTDHIDIDRYFARVGFAGPASPTLAALQQLHMLHPQAIPFENLDPLLRRPVRLDLASLQQKLLIEGRGGYCFEHNLLFARVLEAIGFRVTMLAARVLWNRPDDAITPRSHMLLRVTIDGEDHIADVGFGGVTLTAPLRLKAGVEQQTPHELFRLVETGGYYLQQVRLGADWRTLYRFDLAEQFPVDYEVSNHFLTTHPASHFLNALIAARPAADRRHALAGNQLTVYHLHGTVERRKLSASEIRQTLERDFLIRLPDDPGLEAALERVAAG